MYPISIKIKDKLCVVIGGGSVAARKVKGVLEKQARVKLISPEINHELRRLVMEGKVDWLARKYQPGDLAGSFLVFAATENIQAQEAVQKEADKNKILINRADTPEKSTFHVPASFQRGDLQVAVFTGGKSPAMAAKVKSKLENEIGAEYGILLELVSAVRGRIIADDDNNPRKARLFQKLFHIDMLDWIKQGQWDMVEQHFTALLGTCDEIDWETYRRKIV